MGVLVTTQTGTLSPDGVRTMFDRIAPVYDLMNRLMSAGLDQRWRRMTADAVVHPGDRVLDACCGTGDLALAGQAAGGVVTGLDFSERMLERARAKSSTVEWIRGDLLELPFADAAFDAATVGFGIRNVADLHSGLEELARVLRPGGRLGILEITQPRGLLRPSTSSGSTASCRSPASSCPAARPTRTCPPASAAFLAPTCSPACSSGRASTTCATGFSPAVSSPSIGRAP